MPTNAANGNNPVNVSADRIIRVVLLHSISHAGQNNISELVKGAPAGNQLEYSKVSAHADSLEFDIPGQNGIAIPMHNILAAEVSAI